MKLSLRLQANWLQHALTRLIGRLAYVQWGWFKNCWIKYYCKYYRIDLREAEEENYTNYPHFNAFFTRRLKSKARPLQGDEQAIVAPVDGTIYQWGELTADQKLLVKKQPFSLAGLLGDSGVAEQYLGGTFVVIYLSPADYHRVHAPVAGQINLLRYLPGRLFSVQPQVLDALPGVLARNERVVMQFMQPKGDFSLVLVGALIVGSIRTALAGTLNSTQRQVVLERHYPQPISVAKGEEIAQFELGSTVVLLFPSAAQVKWQQLAVGKKVKMGEILGYQDDCTAA